MKLKDKRREGRAHFFKQVFISTAMATARRFCVCVTLAFSLVVEWAAGSDIASVYIFNRINTPIEVVCKNKDGHIAIESTLLARDQHVGLVFKPSIWGTSKVACDFTWVALEQHHVYVQSFNAWYDSSIWFSDPAPCRQCTWIVTPSGFTEYKDGELGPVVATHNWITKG